MHYFLLSSVSFFFVSLLFNFVPLFIASFKLKREIKKVLKKNIISIINYLLPFKMLTRIGFYKRMSSFNKNKKMFSQKMIIFKSY